MEAKNKELNDLTDSLNTQQKALLLSQSQIQKQLVDIENARAQALAEANLERARSFIDNIEFTEGYAIVGTRDKGYGILDTFGKRHFAGELPDRSITPFDSADGTARAEQYYWFVRPKQDGSGVDSLLECCRPYRIDLRQKQRLLMIDRGAALNSILRDTDQARYWQERVGYIRLDDEEMASLDSAALAAFRAWLPGSTACPTCPR